MVEIPDDLEVILKIDKKDIPKAVKLYLAIELYRERKISLGKASEIAGISKEEMMKVGAILSIISVVIIALYFSILSSI